MLLKRALVESQFPAMRGDHGLSFWERLANLLVYVFWQTLVANANTWRCVRLQAVQRHYLSTFNWSELLENTSDRFASSQLTDSSERAEVDLFIDDPKSVELSVEFIGRWSTLVSTTNWEKGRIIVEWREALVGSQTPTAAYSDEAWSRRVGGVSPQHVGRLRRVYERFGATQESFRGIYWSHFLAALDWDDAEMWLEGAVRSQWSVAQMRRTRWEAMGAQPELEPSQEDIAADGSISVGVDDDYAPLAEVDNATGAADGPRSVAEGPRPDGPDFGDEDYSASSSGEAEDEALPWEEENKIPGQSPFATLPSLPVDLAEALEQFKLAIIRHRADSWAEVSQADVQRALDALKAFAAL